MSVSQKKPEVVVFAGPNGSGKRTKLKTYIEVPFIGMDDEEVEIVADDFDGFIDYVWGKE